jgi:hypothetical protein
MTIVVFANSVDPDERAPIGALSSRSQCNEIYKRKTT